jgi:hypothetical protein
VVTTRWLRGGYRAKRRGGEYVQGEAALRAKQEGRCAEAQSFRKKNEYAPRATVALPLRRAAAMAVAAAAGAKACARRGERRRARRRERRRESWALLHRPGGRRPGGRRRPILFSFFLMTMI